MIQYDLMIIYFFFYLYFLAPFKHYVILITNQLELSGFLFFCNKLSVYLKRKLYFLHQVICFPILSLELSGVNSLRDSLSLRIVFRYDSLVVNMRLHHWIHQFYVKIVFKNRNFCFSFFYLLDFAYHFNAPTEIMC